MMCWNMLYHLDVIPSWGCFFHGHTQDTGIQDASIFLAVTTLENVNIVAAILAKNWSKTDYCKINNMTNLQQDAKQSLHGTWH